MTKAELQKTIEELNTDNQECFALLDEYMYRQIIIECTLKLDDRRLLKCACAYMKKLSE